MTTIPCANCGNPRPANTYFLVPCFACGDDGETIPDVGESDAESARISEERRAEEARGAGVHVPSGPSTPEDDPPANENEGENHG